MQSKLGVLMVNLGTPDAPTPQAIKRYLAEFLSDRRVVDTSPWLWWPLLRGVILPIRSPRVAKLYQSVWFELFRLYSTVIKYESLIGWRIQL